MDIEAWLRLMRNLGLAEHRPMFEKLWSAYAAPQRYYHTVAHISMCLQELKHFSALAKRVDEVAAALWFHDFVYAPRASDNEKRSAEKAASFFTDAGLDPDACARIHTHIMATQHQAQPADSDAALVVDIDLAILGQEPKHYDRFEAEVRAEYKWVPSFLYRSKRVEVLRSFLERPYIYTHFSLREKYETPARLNIERTIKRLSFKSA